MKYCILLVLQLCFLLTACSSTDKEMKQSLLDEQAIESNDTKVEGPWETKISLELNGDTAAQLAEVFLVSIYGEKVLEQKPWKVIDNGTYFTIKGVLPRGSAGGVAKVEIRKSDAKIMKYSHGK